LWIGDAWRSRIARITSLASHVERERERKRGEGERERERKRKPSTAQQLDVVGRCSWSSGHSSAPWGWRLEGSGLAYQTVDSTPAVVSGGIPPFIYQDAIKWPEDTLKYVHQTTPGIRRLVAA
jgi:hypothetical protein